MTEFDENQTIVRTLFRELELGEHSETRILRNLRGEFGGILTLEPGSFQKIAFDAAVVTGVSGDWELAIEILARMEGLGDDRLEIKLWQLRALVELEKFAEALAISNAIRWEPRLMVHVNYLTGLTFEALGMIDKARLRFDAVFKVNASYRGVALKLSSY